VRRLIPIVTLAAAFAAGCSNSSTSPSGSIVGTYTLQTINGSTLPYTVSSTRAISSEQLSLNNDGTYNDVSRYTDGSSFTEVGYYTQYNNAITFNDQTDNLTYQGSVSGNVLTEISNGFTAAYQKN
jgi:hypothetical protein